MTGLTPIRKYQFYSASARFFAATLDSIGYPIFNFFRLFKKTSLKNDIKNKNLKKILVIRLDDIGDVLLATPFIRELKNNFPSAKIDMLVKNSTKEVLASNSRINKVYFYHPLWMRTNSPEGILDTIKVIKNLRKADYDAIFELRGNPFNIILASLLKSRYKIGYANQGFGFLLTNPIITKEKEKEKHEIEKNLDILRALNLSVKSKNPEIFISKEEKIFANDFFKKHKDKNQIAVAIHAGTPWHPKRWPKERFAEVADFLIKKHNAKVILLGNKDEIALNNEITNLQAEQNKRNIVNLAGKTSLKEAASIISKCSLFIGNDSGLMQIASASNIPLIALLWGTGQKSFAPTGKNSIVLYKKAECSFSGVQKMGELCSCNSSPCKALLKITADNAIKASEKIIKGL